jgi:hypothetical protein
MDWIRLIFEHPDPALIVLIGVGALVFVVGRISGKVTSLEEGAKKLATKQDIDLALSTFAQNLAKDLDDRLVSKKECELTHRGAYIPLSEHAKVLADIEMLKEKLLARRAAEARQS